MWPDRFPALSTSSGTPPPQSRSPAPRRPHLGPGSLPHRPSFGPRSSSLSLASTVSSTTATGNARLTNGSGLKNEVYTSPNNFNDPLSILRDILGGPPKAQKSELSSEGSDVDAQRPVELVQDIDFGGLSLEEYVRPATTSKQVGPLPSPQAVQSAEEYHRERDKFDDLHRSILACDEVLKSVEIYLTGFQADLGVVSAEIETLQRRSTALNTRLENRKVVEKLLGPSVEDFSLSPVLVRKIAEGPIDDAWVRALMELEKRSKIINGKGSDQDIKALTDLKPLLSNLNDRAAERIRDHLVAQIKAVRSPSINAQVIQTQSFLPYKELYAFLARHQPQLAEEIAQAYINTLRWYYLSNFTRYRDALLKLQLHVIEKTEVLASEDTSNAGRGGLLRGSTAKAATSAAETFSLGRRSEILKNPSASAIPSHVAEEDKASHHLESPFRAFNQALVDNACFEFSFLSGFFSPTQSFSFVSRTFTSIFEPTFQMGHALTRQLVEATNDALGVLLCIRINQQFAFQLQRRKVPTVEGYNNGTNMLLWPRFQLLIDAHCESLKRASTALPNRSGVASTIINAGSGGSGAASTAPHPLTQRFATFVAGILSLSADASDDEPVGGSISRLRTDFDSFLGKLAKSGGGDARRKDRFIENNWSLVMTIIEGIGGRLAEEFRTWVQEKK